MDPNLLFYIVLGIVLLVGLVYRLPSNLLMVICVIMVSVIAFKDQLGLLRRANENPKSKAEVTAYEVILKNTLYELDFLRKFNKDAFKTIDRSANRLIKIYTYLLGERYNCTTHVPEFEEVRQDLLSTIFSLPVSTPMYMKHMYGVSPANKVSEIYNRTAEITLEMKETLYRYCSTKNPVFTPYPDKSMPANQKNLDLKGNNVFR